MEKERETRWIFTKSELINTPSRKAGLDTDKELAYRQQAATLIQDMGQRLQVTQLCINTALVYMHRFYMYNSFTKFHRNAMAPVCIFLAAKVEEQPRKLEHVLKERHRCLERDKPFDNKSDAYLEQAQELVIYENILLQTLGFDITVDHPHTHVVKTCQLVRASKDFAQTSYFLATNSLHLTTMCLQYPPTVVACVCIHLASKWADYEINTSKEGKEWYWYIDKTVTLEMLEELTQDFLTILDKCPDKLKRNIMSKVSKRGLMDKDDEQPSKQKRIKSEPVATVTSSAAAVGELGFRSVSQHLLPGQQPVKVSGDMDSQLILSRPHGDALLLDMSAVKHPTHNTPLLSMLVKADPDPTVPDNSNPGMHDLTNLIVGVDNIKQEKASPAPEKLSLRDYRQRVEQRPPSRSQPVKDVKPPDMVASNRLALKEAKVVVHDLEHSHGQDKLMFRNAINRRQSGEGTSEHKRHHHHSIQDDLRLKEARSMPGDSHHPNIEDQIGINKNESGSKSSSLKLLIKVETTGSHSSPLKAKYVRHPETSVVDGSSNSSVEAKMKKESLKVRLTIPGGTHNRVDQTERSSVNRKHSSQGESGQKMIVKGNDASNLHVISASHNSNGHDRKRSKHSRSHSHTNHYDSNNPQLNAITLDGSNSSHKRALTSTTPAPRQPEQSTQSLNSSLPKSSTGSSYGGHRPHLQSQYSGFSFQDNFLNSMPDDIFEPDTPTGLGDMNGLGGFEAPQTPTPENLIQVQAHMQQMFAQHRSYHQHHHHHQQQPQHSFFHHPPPPPPPSHHPHIYNADSNRYSEIPPLPPPLPPEPNPPPPPPSPPSHM